MATRTCFSFALSCLFLLLVCLTSLASSSSSSSSSPLPLSPRRQASILVSIKQDFELAAASANSSLRSWDVSNYLSLCTWYGIRCDPNNSSVVSLDISNLNVSGSLSPSIAGLSALVSVSVAGNSLSGEFPSAGGIERLTRLRYLNISGNMFGGNLSSWEFRQLKDLRVLDAYDNSFNGSLPLWVTRLTKLTHLNFGGNYFSGRIPASYGNYMRQLNFLSLAGNSLSGFIPSELGNLTDLTHLYLGYYNNFDGGTIPPDFGKLVNLVHLDLASCGLKGPIPSEFGRLYKLDTLFLQKNQLAGSIPPQLGNLTRLKVLDLSYNNELTGEIPDEFSGLQELTVLNLFINRFHGEIPRFVAELPKLETLCLWQNNFTGAIPSMLGHNGRLTVLDLSTNKLTGTVPNPLCLGRRLKILILRKNFLFGSLPADLGQCYTLQKVRLGQNYLTGALPKGFLHLPNLSLLELQNNYLSGRLPQETTSTAAPSSKLGQLNLSNNRLSGPLPAASIANFPRLQMLLLSGNRFSGEIPAEIGRLKSILKLDISINNFSGSIPPEIGNCSLLTYLDLSQNQLSGPIPVQVSRIQLLNYLNVSWNRLSRSLPRELGALKGLTAADFSHNNFSGSIPETGQFSSFNSTYFVGNPRLCGYESNPCSCPDSRAKHVVPRKFKVLFVLALFGCSLVFAALAVFKSRTARRRSNAWRLTAFQKLVYSSEDIVGCLKESNVIGRGGAGVVYRGTMPDGEEVAVKKLFAINKGSSHDNGLSAEIRTLGKIRHRYIVRLVAFCSNKETNLLVYEYMRNGSLGEVLHGNRREFLKWETRLKIATEAAKGLCYLHHDCSPLIIHRDVKSNNILLNSEYEAHVADFGLAKFMHHTGASSECMSSIAGSYGYIAPEYAYTLKVDEKSDVYSFGVVLLELVTGRRPVGDFGEEGLDIVQWTKMQTNWNKEMVMKVLDERLHHHISIDEAKHVLFVAMLCVHEHSVERPTMREVVEMLDQAKQPNRFHIK